MILSLLAFFVGFYDCVTKTCSTLYLCLCEFAIRLIYMCRLCQINMANTFTHCSPFRNVGKSILNEPQCESAKYLRAEIRPVSCKGIIACSNLDCICGPSWGGQTWFWRFSRPAKSFQNQVGVGDAPSVSRVRELLTAALPLDVGLTGLTEMESTRNSALPLDVGLTGFTEIESTRNPPLFLDVGLISLTEMKRTRNSALPLDLGLTGLTEIESTINPAPLLFVGLTNLTEIKDTRNSALYLDVELTGLTEMESTKSSVFHLDVELTGLAEMESSRNPALPLDIGLTSLIEMESTRNSAFLLDVGLTGLIENEGTGNPALPLDAGLTEMERTGNLSLPQDVGLSGLTEIEGTRSPALPPDVGLTSLTEMKDTRNPALLGRTELDNPLFVFPNQRSIGYPSAVQQFKTRREVRRFWWWWIFLLLICVSQVDCINPSTSGERQRTASGGGRRINPITTAKMQHQFRHRIPSLFSSSSPICGSRRIVKDIRQMETLRGCRVIEGNLQIVLIEMPSNMSHIWNNYTYPELVEITGFFLVFRVDGLKSLGQVFPNLSVIRGVYLQTYYSLVIYKAYYMRVIGLHSLTSIMRGSVRIQDNHNLCHVDTVDWSAITENKITENVFQNNNENTCTPCRSSKCPSGNCWSTTQCQRICSSKCHNQGCISPTECCHELCIGGCTRKNDSTACFACRYVSKGDACVRDCGEMYKYLNYRCVENRDCINMSPRHRLYTSPEGEKECVLQCPVGYQEDYREYNGGKKARACIKCVGPCNKPCPGRFINSIQKAHSLRGCTKINGSLIISITGGKNISNKLSESLRYIREVTDYVRVFSSNSLMSLDFLSSIQVIKGQKLYIGKYALYIHDNENLEMIWDWRTRGNLTISKKSAMVLFHTNPKLCYKEIEQLLDKIGQFRAEANLDMKISNGNKIACRIVEQEVSLKAMNNRGVIRITWNGALTTNDDRMPTGYYVFYQATNGNVSYLTGRDACFDNWTKKYVEIKTSDSRITRYLKGLKPYTRYAIYVETGSVVDFGDGTRTRSEIEYITTMPFNPSSPRNLRVMKEDENTVSLSWSPPLHANGVIHYYGVRVKPIDVQEDNSCPIPNEVPASDITLQEKDSTSVTPSPYPNTEDEVEFQPEFVGDCCACPPEPPENKWKQLQADNTFEDTLFNAVYLGRTLLQRDDAIDDIDSTYDNTVYYVDSSDMDVDVSKEKEPIETEYAGPVPITNIHRVSRTDDYSGIWEGFTKNTNITLSGLHHFMQYHVEVVACHNYQPKSAAEPSEKQKTLCSLEPASIPVMTHMKIGANEVTNIEVEEGNEPGVWIVSWDKPPDPNGKLLAYIIILQPQTTLSPWSSAIAPIEICVSTQEFEERNNTYELSNSKFRHPDIYTLSIKTYTSPPISSNESYGNILIDNRVDIAEDSVSITSWTVLIVFLFLLVVGTIYCFYKTSSKKVLVYETGNDHYFTGTQTWSQRIEDSFPSNQILQMEDLQLDNDFELGKGNFGVVLRGRLNKNSKSIDIAAKVIADSQAKDEILDEAKLMLKLNCYHLVKALGIAAGPSQVYLVMEYMSRRDLRRYLQNLKAAESDIFSVLSIDEVCGMAVQIADGMAYLGSYKIVHRDLAARNCLVDDQRNVKISDFGMSRIMNNDYYVISKTKCFPVRWLPPEYLEHSRFTTQSDVWSFGVVLWEIMSGGATPYKRWDDNSVLEHVRRGYTLESEIPSITPSFLRNVATGCWDFDSHKRPIFPQIITELLPNTSPRFSEHFRTVSFHYSNSGQDYRHHLEMIQNAELENNPSSLVTKTTSSPRTLDDSQPPPLPVRPLWRLKWPSSLSFRGLSATRDMQYSMESPLTRNASTKSNSTELAVTLHDVNQIKPKKRTLQNELTVNTSELVEEHASSSFEKEANVIMGASSKLHNSASDTGLFSEGCSDLKVPTNDVIVSVDKHGTSSSLAFFKSSTKPAYGKLSKPFGDFRSISSPNIKPTAC